MNKAVVAWLKKPRRKGPTAITGLYCSELGHEVTSESMLATNQEQLFDDLSDEARSLYGKLLRQPGRRRRYVVPYERIIEKFDLKTKFHRFRETSLALMTDACRGLLRETGYTTGDFDFLIVNYMAGKTLPSLAALLANALELRPSIVSYTLGDMGCSAGVASVDLAVRLLRAEQRPKRALVVSLEPVSNLFEHSDDPGAIVGNTLFGEGCAAVAVSSHREPALWRIDGGVRVLMTNDDSKNAITLAPGETGPMIQLSKEIPAVAGQAITENLKRLVPSLLTPAEKLQFLATRKVPRWQKHIDRWAVHPGGIQVLRALQKHLKLSDADLGPSYRVFEERSNMSSPSCFYALQNIEKAGPKQGERALVMSFGSGFKVNSLVLVKGPKRHHAAVERNAVVVGGTSGIGADTAARLSAEGYRIWAGSRRVQADGSGDFQRLPGVRYLPLDVTDEDSLQAFSDAVWQQTFGVDVVVISSGVAGMPAAVGRADPEQWQQIVDTNLTGAMRVVNALLPRVRSGGRLVLVNSMLGRIPLMGSAAYCAAKAGLHHFARSLELELRRDGRKVTVHSVFPAYVETPMLDEIKEDKKARPLLKPVQVKEVTDQIDALLNGHPVREAFVGPRDRAIDAVSRYLPGAYRAIITRM